MKTLKLTVLALFLCTSSASLFAQTADEIINNYIKNTGGQEKWQQLKGTKMSAKMDEGGILLPLDVYAFANGKSGTVINFQGQTLYQNMFDGETLWSTNFQNMQAEKSDKETTENHKLQANDFPDDFLNYKSKGYTAELLGKEKIEGTEVFKIKLTKEPETVDGKQVPSISFYYFDTENFVPLQLEKEEKSGQMKGMVVIQKMSDYKEIDGLYFPFSIVYEIKGQGSQAIKIDKVELNPIVSDSFFNLPAKK
jgi:outer membrane lipoprotein-sorting protein